MGKVAVIGIDGLDYRLTSKWWDELKSFKALSQGGCFGRLESVIPTLSCPSWPCMYTGKTPEELDIYDFIDIQTGKLVTSSNWWFLSLFNDLEMRYGKRQVLCNLPFTYPSQTKSTLTRLLCGMGSPDFPYIDIGTPDKENKNSHLFRKYLLDEHNKALEALWGGNEWDLFFHVYYLTDPIQHYFWKYLDGRCGEDYELYKDEILNTYKLVSLLVKDLVKLLPLDCKILVVSDHGFGPYTKGFNVNRWLEQEGYLTYKAKVKQPLSVKMRNIGGKVLPRTFIEKLPEWVISPFSVGKELSNMTTKLYANMDHEKSKAYSPSMSSGLIITDSNDIAYEIRKKLELINVRTHPWGHKRVYIIGDGIYPMNSWSKDIWLDHTWSGSHTLDGVIISNCEEAVDVQKVTEVAPLIKRWVLE